MFDSKVQGPALEFGNENIGMRLHSPYNGPMLWIKDGPWDFFEKTDGINKGTVYIQQLIVTESGGRVVQKVELRRPFPRGKATPKSGAPSGDASLRSVSPLFSDAAKVANFVGRESASADTQTRQGGVRGVNSVIPLKVTIRSEEWQQSTDAG